MVRTVVSVQAGTTGVIIICSCATENSVRPFNLRQADIAFFLSYFYLLIGRAQNAIDFLMCLIHDSLPNGAGMLKSTVRILEIMVHSDLGNKDLIESKLQKQKIFEKA